MMPSQPAGSDSPKFKQGRIEVKPGVPLSFIEDPSVGNLSNAAAGTPNQVGATIKSYRDAAKQLLAGKYKDLQPFAPSHLREPCNITVIRCTDGLLIRYDTPSEIPVKIRIATVDKSLSEFGPPFTDYLIHFPLNRATYDPGPNGPRLELAKFNKTSDEVRPIVSVRPLIFASLAFPEGTVFLPPPHKPPCLVSVTSEIEILLDGVIIPADADPSLAEGTHQFIARSKMKLQTGWQMIEAYPQFDIDYWKPEYAPLWAETDLLAAVARRQFADAQFAALDSNVTARKTFQNLISQFMVLLDGPEEPLHQFLKMHPELICPAHTRFWSKLPLGERVTDFVFQQPASEYLLVELESPLRELFRKDGQQREELTHAFNQILDWRVYLEDNLGKAQNDLGLLGISSNPDSLIVIGRSSYLSDENRRKLTTLQNQVPKLRILTYDDLLKHAKTVAENLFGPLDITGYNADIYFIPTST